MNLGTTISCSAGDTFQLVMTQDSGTSIGIGSGVDTPWFYARRVYDLSTPNEVLSILVIGG